MPQIARAVLLLTLFSAASSQAGEIRLLAGSEIASQTGAGPTHPVALSADGRFVLLRSSAPNLIAGQVDTNGADDLFLRDRSAGTLTLITHRAGAPSATADQGSWAAAMSPDGEWVLFHSWANDLIAGLEREDPFSSDVYLWRRSTGALALASHLPGAPLVAAGKSRAVALSSDGAVALFDSDATNLVDGTTDENRASDVFAFSRTSGNVALISASGSTTLDGASTGVALSASGAEAFFNTVTGSEEEALVRAVAGGSVQYLVLAAGGSSVRAITPNGRRALVDIAGSGTVIADRDASSAILVDNGSTRGTALSADGTSALYEKELGIYYRRVGLPAVCLDCDASFRGGGGHSLSADGRFALYWQQDWIGQSGVYLYDATTGTSSPVLPAGAERPAVAYPYLAGLSADASLIVLAAADPDLVPGIADRNGNFDAFAIERVSSAVHLLSPSAAAGPVATTLGSASYPTSQSASGDEILFRGPAYLLDPAHPTTDVAAWAYRVADGGRRLLSPRPGQPQVPAAGWLEPLALDDDGRVLISGTSDELVPGALTGPASQLYLYTPATQSYRLLTLKAGSNPPQGTVSLFGAVQPRRALGSRVLFLSTDAGLVAGLAPLGRANLFSCDTDGSGCALLTPSAADPHAGADQSITELRVSADAAVAVFSSYAGNLVEEETGSFSNIFRWRHGKGLDLASRSAADPDQGANSSSYAAAVSGDGRFALVTSWATDLDPDALDGNGSGDVFLGDLDAGTWELVSGTGLDPSIASSGYSRGLAISDGGRFVLFSSMAQDLVLGMTSIPPAPGAEFEALFNLFVYDRVTRQKRLVSHLPGELQAAAGSAAYGYLSRDGSRVAFYSTSPHLSPENPAGLPALYFWDGDGGGPQLVHLSQGGPYLFYAFPNFFETQYFDGSRLPFSSFYDNVTPGDTNGNADAFVVLLDALFRDGFESGDTRAWSLTQP